MWFSKLLVVLALGHTIMLVLAAKLFNPTQERSLTITRSPLEVEREAEIIFRRTLLTNYFGIDRTRSPKIMARANEVEQFLLSMPQVAGAQYLLNIFNQARAAGNLPVEIEDSFDQRAIEIGQAVRQVINEHDRRTKTKEV